MGHPSLFFLRAVRVAIVVIAAAALVVIAPADGMASQPPLSWASPAAFDHGEPLGAGTAVNAISCPTATFCAMVDQHGNVLTSSDPSGGWSAWTISHVNLASHQVLGGSWEGAMTAVSCPSQGLCVAADSFGNVFSTTDPTGGPAAWRTTRLNVPSPFPGAINQLGLIALSCPNAGLCVGINVQGQILTSTNPASGGDWGVIQGSQGGLVALSCPTADLCVAIASSGAVLYSTDPGAGAWQTGPQLPSGIVGVSCPSSALCVAIGASGTVLTSTDPASASGTWNSTAIETGSGLTGVSCASESFCTVASSSSVYVSTQPTGGAQAWASAAVDTYDSAYENRIQVLDCPSASLCVAADGEGNTVTSSDPAGGSAAWRLQLVDATPVPKALSCDLGSACVAVDSGGNILTSTNPTTGTASWHPLHVTNGAITWAGCFAAGFCLAGGFASANPNAGAASWKPVPDVSPPAQCPTLTLCIETASILTPPASLAISAGPFAAQQPVVLAARTGEMAAMDAVSCPSGSLCVGAVTVRRLVGNVWWPVRRRVVVSTDPASPGSWKLEPPRAPALNAVVCPSPTLCVASTGNAEVATTTDPTDGARTWKVTAAPAGKQLTSIACPSEWLCVASDTTGDLLTWSNPGTGAATWTTQHVTDDFIEQPSCISTSSCAALTFGGLIVVGTGVPGAYEDGAASARRAVVNSRGPRVTIECHGISTDRCRTKLKLTFRHRAAIAGMRFADVRAGGLATPRVPLNAAARRQLKSHHRLHLDLTITATAHARTRVVSRQIITVTAPRG